jgi:hypothetical protein
VQIKLVQITPPQIWQRLEFGIVIVNGPAIANPFDSDIITLNATFTLPSGASMIVPVFWYQAYQRSLSGTNEVDTAITNPATVSPGWHLRFTPPMAGSYSLSFEITKLNNHLVHQTVPIVASNGTTSNSTPLHVPPLPPKDQSSSQHGYVGIAPGGRYFQTGDGHALPLIGHNVCWPGGEGTPNEGTYNYDMGKSNGYFGNMAKNGENYARIWMCPFSFGIEPAPDWIYPQSEKSVTLYSLQTAWQLDYILQLAERYGIYLLLCLDYHGILDENSDWPKSPYNSANGGPCSTPNDFFTNSTAKKIYQKRLRYLVARYGYSQNLLAWEFFNEIDNDYAYLNASDVAAWHGVMGDWLHNHDPFHHLRTTSLTNGGTTLPGGSTPPSIWQSLDFTTYHSYGEAAPATRFATIANQFLQAYKKPVIIGEFGTNYAGWGGPNPPPSEPPPNDPYLRGFRQGIWGGALGGSVGTGMSWWWQEIDTQNDYAVYRALGTILKNTGWGSGIWNPILFDGTSGAPSAIGLQGSQNKSLLYVVAPGVEFGSPGATAPLSSLPVIQSQTITLMDWPHGKFTAKWFDPATATVLVNTQAITSPNGNLVLPLPPFQEDLAAFLFKDANIFPIQATESPTLLKGIFGE